MTKPEILKSSIVLDIFRDVINKGISLNISYLTDGKWKLTSGEISQATEDSVEITPAQAAIPCSEILRVEQPVGISFKMDHSKFVFESRVVTCNCENGGFVLELPEKIEKMPRRSYIRVPVPEKMFVRVIFWHRGHNDDKDFIPKENCWEGKLINLSAGGMKISISEDKKCHFEPGQLVGLQFTPMPYEKPVLLEGLIRHIEEKEGFIELGMEFLGLEASWEGRTKTRKLVDIVEKYDSIRNNDDKHEHHED